MIQRSFAELVKDLRMRRTVGDRPPILLLGAGASIDAGIGAMPELFQFFDCANFKEFCKYIQTTTASERYRYLSEFLQTRKPGEVSPGYQALASLCAQNYFDLVLTTNMDPLLDDALAAARLWRRDYLLLVNGVMRPDRFSPLLVAESPRVKVIKLHGDIFQRFMAWTVAEMDTFLTEVSPHLSPAIAGRDFLVVGYSLRDLRVRELLEAAGGSIWFTHPEAVPAHLKKTKADLRVVVAPNCAFEKFFPALAKSLEVEVPQEPLDAARLELHSHTASARGAQTMDDLMTSIFAVALPSGMPSSTAFLLAEPRVIVCDRFAVEACITHGKAKLIASGQRRFEARVLRADEAHPFGPTLLEPPADLHALGMRIATTPMRTGSLVQVAVAAGEKTGISTGTVTQPQLDPQVIAPLGQRVPNLVELRCVVAPGSSGAPVVDDSMAVRAFVVAGSSDDTNPRTFAYPAQCWKATLASGGSGRPASGKRRRPRGS
jgi:SIR2-like domain